MEDSNLDLKKKALADKLILAGNNKYFNQLSAFKPKYFYLDDFTFHLELTSVLENI